MPRSGEIENLIFECLILDIGFVHIMTSLKQQLERFKSAATHSLTIERDYSSLLFDKKEASSHNREDFYKIGLLFTYELLVSEFFPYKFKTLIKIS